MAMHPLATNLASRDRESPFPVAKHETFSSSYLFFPTLRSSHWLALLEPFHRALEAGSPPPSPQLPGSHSISILAKAETWLGLVVCNHLHKRTGVLADTNHVAANGMRSSISPAVLGIRLQSGTRRVHVQPLKMQWQARRPLTSQTDQSSGGTASTPVGPHGNSVFCLFLNFHLAYIILMAF